MYERDKKTRITVRVNDDQFNYVNEMATMLGISPSEYIRQTINAGMYGMQHIKKEMERRENEKTDIDS